MVLAAAHVDIASPFLYAIATVIIGGLTYVFTRFGRAVIGDQVDPKLAPFYKRLDEHLATEEADRRETREDVKAIRDELRMMRDNQTQDNRRIWQAIDEIQTRRR